MIRFIKLIYKYITSSEYPVADMIWQLDADIDSLNAFIINAEKEISK